MMVTRDMLRKQTAEREAEENRIAEERKRAHKILLKQYEKEDISRAETTLDTDLGDFLQACNLKKYNQIWLEQHRAFRGDSFENRREIYSTSSSPGYGLKFSPDPKSKATKILIEKLRNAGFEAEVVTRSVRNRECRLRGDGEYEFYDAPGSHDEHWLRIAW